MAVRGDFDNRGKLVWYPAGPPTQLFARAADFSDVTTDCDVTKFYEPFFCCVFGIY